MCGGGESRHQESGLKTNRSVLFNWNLKFQGKVWKVKSVVQTRGYADPLGYSIPGTTGNHVVQRPPSPVADPDTICTKAEPVVGCVLTLTHVTSDNGYGHVDAHLTRHEVTLGQLSSGVATRTSKKSSCHRCSSQNSSITFVLKHFPPSPFKIKQKALTQAKFLPVKREHCQRLWTPVEILLLLLILCVRCLATLIISDSIRSQRENGKVNTVTMSPG